MAKVNAYPPKLNAENITPEGYRRWRRQWQLWQSEAPCDANRIGRRTMQVLESSQAWDAVEGIPTEDILSEGGGEIVIEALDDLFDYNEEEQLQKAFDDLFDSTEREPNKEMKMYIVDQKNKWNHLTRIIGMGCVFPEELKGYMLLKKSNIPIKEHRLILTAAHLSYRFDDLAKAMRSQYDGRLVRKKAIVTTRRTTEGRDDNPRSKPR